MEKWRDIEGYEGLYQVSNLGRVRSVAFRNNKIIKPKERILSPINHGNGYLYVTLCKNNIHKNHYIHRLVAKAFVFNNDTNKKVVNHIDYDRSNNVSTNLEWCTQKENTWHSRENFIKGLVGRKQRATNTGEKNIVYRENKKLYRVIVKKKEKSAKTLEEAIKIRNEWLNETIQHTN